MLANFIVPIPYCRCISFTIQWAPFCRRRRMSSRLITSTNSKSISELCLTDFLTLSSLPIGRFAAYLRRNNELDKYMQLLIEAFNPATIKGLMCRNTVSVGWRGEVYDCDFNQQLGMQWNNGQPVFLWDVNPDSLEGREIMTGDHCFGCTAGAGSSCGGAIV